MPIDQRIASITLKEVDTLWVVEQLADVAHMGAIQKKMETIHGPLHKQNFRRTIAQLAARGLLVQVACRISTGGRPARARMVLTEEGQKCVYAFAAAAHAAYMRYTRAKS